MRTYHDFSLLGLPTDQLSRTKALNQVVKQQVLFAYILKAMNECRRKFSNPLTVAELFCADAYFAMFAAKFGADHVYGFDINERDLANGRQIASHLGLSNVTLERCDVHEISAGPFSIVLNVGGLYHVSDPETVLRKSHAMARDFLIVQTAVSLASDDPDYFETPAPGWTWGHRSSRQWFEALIRKLSYKVVEQHFLEYPGCDRPEDRGGIFYLISKS